MTEAEKTIQLIQEKSNEMGGIVVKWADGEKERLGLVGVPDDQPPRIYVNNLPKDCNQVHHLFIWRVISEDCSNNMV